ncbi:putative reverse transcriptase domain-containing protein [Tanacetum coccineum]
MGRSAEAVPEDSTMISGRGQSRVVELAELHERDTQDLYALLEDAQDGRSRISQRVDMNSQRVDLLMGDRMTLQETVWMVEEEAYASREAWAHSIGLSQATHQELQTHRDHVYAHETITGHRHSLATEYLILRHSTRYEGEMSDMQAELLALREQRRRARQPGPEARIPDHQEASGDADSHIYVTLNFKGLKAWSGYTRWFAKMEQFPYQWLWCENQVKFATASVRCRFDLVEWTAKGSLMGDPWPKCNKCHLHHNGPCTQRCHKCNKIGHFARDCRNTSNTNIANTQKGNGETPKGNGCFECGAPGHFKRDYPKLKNKNGGNGNAQGWLYAVECRKEGK